MDTKKIMSREDVMEMFNISPSTLWRWQKEKKVKHYKMGQLVYFIYDELIDSLKREGGCDG